MTSGRSPFPLPAKADSLHNGVLMMKKAKTHSPIPRDHPVRPLRKGQKAKDRATCGHCGLSWDDGKVTSLTPAPSARCPFEMFHIYQKPRVHEVTVRFVVDADYLPTVVENLWSDWPDWLVGVYMEGHATRAADEDECESMCWDVVDEEDA